MRIFIFLACLYLLFIFQRFWHLAILVDVNAKAIYAMMLYVTGLLLVNYLMQLTMKV